MHYQIRRCCCRNKKGNEKKKQFLKTNGNENMMTQNLWNSAKMILRGKFIAIKSYFKK